MDNTEPSRCGVCTQPFPLTAKGVVRRHGPCEGGGQRPLAVQYGVRWKEDGPVFAYSSRDDAQHAIASRGSGVLVSAQGIPGRPWDNWTPVTD